MGPARPIRWLPPCEDPALAPQPGLGAWAAAEPLSRTSGELVRTAPAGELACELLGRSIWTALAPLEHGIGRDAPVGRVEGLASVVPATPRRARAALGAAAPSTRRRHAGRLPLLSLRTLPTLPRHAAGEEPAPPLTGLALPPGLVLDLGFAAPVFVPERPPEPELPEPQQRRVVRRVGLGPPLVFPAAPREPEPDAAWPEEEEPAELEPVATVVHAIPRRRLAAASEGSAGRAARQESGAGVAIVARRRAAALVQDDRREVETVPPDVRAAIEAATGVDLGDVPVHRGPATTAAAQALRARAFAVDGEVHLPAEHGPLTAAPTRALLAHELVHVAQQRRLGPELPPEDSPYGRVLEAQARAVEWSLAPPAAAGAAPPAPPGVQRALEEEPAAVAQPAPPPPPPAPPKQRTQSDTELEELANRLYGRIRTRLRRELLVDRERASLLTDGR